MPGSLGELPPHACATGEAGYPGKAPITEAATIFSLLPFWCIDECLFVLKGISKEGECTNARSAVRAGRGMPGHYNRRQLPDDALLFESTSFSQAEQVITRSASPFSRLELLKRSRTSCAGSAPVIVWFHRFGSLF